MRVRLHIPIIAASFLICFSIPVFSVEKSLSLPPDSLSQWYKPASERQVWLHTMFSLRREMQAVGEYARLGDRERLLKWSRKLAGHYRKISEMVPEWKDELDESSLDHLLAAAEKGEFSKVEKSLRKLGQTCKSCHREFRAVTAALFRVPDFRSAKIENRRTGESKGYADSMQTISVLLNRVKIAIEDDRTEAAISALYDFGDNLGDLNNSCGSCHKDAGAVQRVLGDEAKSSLVKLATGVHKSNSKDAGRALGAIAVQVCAKCHSVHRTSYDLSQFIRSGQ